MRTEMTEWYPGATKPVRDGVYERKYDRLTAKALFNKGLWYVGYDNIEMARRAIYTAPCQTLMWRGLHANKSN